tara:strand:+ start:353 stop:793 length:441 start_codon:yes stop_codon:yes gene_type:complete
MFLKLSNKVNKLCNGNNALILFFVVIVGVAICRLLSMEGITSGPFPGAFEQKLVGQTLDKTKVVGLTPEPNRAKTSPSLIAEVAALPDPAPENFIRQDYEMDKTGSLRVIQNAPLVKPSEDSGENESYVRYNSVAPTGTKKALTGY